MYEVRVESAKRLNLLYDDVERHYHVITDLMSAMAKLYFCQACNKIYWRDVTHVCEETCSDCMMSPPCAFEDIRVPCEICNRNFRSQKCFDIHKRRTPKKRTVCERKRYCGTCGALVTRENHECNKRFCQNYKQNIVAGHLCFMRPLKNMLPAGDRVLYVFSISRPLRTRDIRKRPRYSFQIFSVYSSIVRSARMWKMLGVIACNAA